MIATISNPNWIRVSYVTMAFPLPEGKEAKPSMIIKGQPPNVYKELGKIQRDCLSKKYYTKFDIVCQLKLNMNV